MPAELRLKRGAHRARPARAERGVHERLHEHLRTAVERRELLHLQGLVEPRPEAGRDLPERPLVRRAPQRPPHLEGDRPGLLWSEPALADEDHCVDDKPLRPVHVPLDPGCVVPPHLRHVEIRRGDVPADLPEEGPRQRAAALDPHLDRAAQPPPLGLRREQVLIDERAQGPLRVARVLRVLHQADHVPGCDGLAVHPGEDRLVGRRRGPGDADRLVAPGGGRAAGSAGSDDDCPGEDEGEARCRAAHAAIVPGWLPEVKAFGARDHPGLTGPLPGFRDRRRWSGWPTSRRGPSAGSTHRTTARRSARG